jgi:hypothetical protein
LFAGRRAAATGWTGAFGEEARLERQRRLGLSPIPL